MAVAVPPAWQPAYLLLSTLIISTANLVSAARANAMAEAAAPRESRGRHLAAFQYAFTIAQVAAPGVVALFAVAPWLPWLVLGAANLLGIVAIGLVTARLPAHSLAGKARPPG